MLASYPPFYDEDPMKTYAKIMHGAVAYPSHFSKEAVSLIKKLLQHKATKRLGVVKGGAMEISQRKQTTERLKRLKRPPEGVVCAVLTCPLLFLFARLFICFCSLSFFSERHPWFKGFDFDLLVSRKMKPPIVPKIKHNKDMSNFDQFEEVGEVEPYVDDGSKWDEEF